MTLSPHEILERSQLSASSVSTYRKGINAWMAFAPDPHTWGPMAVEAWRDFQLSQGYKGTTVNNNLAAVKFLGRRISDLGLGANFTAGAQNVKNAHTEQRIALTVEEAQAVVATCEKGPRGTRDRAILTMGLRVAMRASELASVEWAGVEPPRVSYVAKGRRWHTAVMDEESTYALGAWRRTSSRIDGRELSDRVFRSILYTIHTPRAAMRDSITRRSIWKIVKTRGEKAGLSRPIHPHLLRHTFVVWALEAGRPLNEIMAQTGHRSLKTLSTYSSDPNAASDPIGNYLPRVL